MKYSNGYCKVIRDSKWGGKAVLIFDKPIKIKVAEVNDEPIIIEANKLTGEYTYSWYWLRNGGRQDKIANGIDIYFKIEKMELI